MEKIQEKKHSDEELHEVAKASFILGSQNWFEKNAVNFILTLIAGVVLGLVLGISIFVK